MAERVYLLCDESDDCDTAVRVYEIPAVLADTKVLLDEVNKVVSGTMFAVVNDYFAIGNVMKTPHPIEEVLESELAWRKRDLNARAKRLRQYKIRIDRKAQTLTFTCAEGHQSWVQSTFEEFLKNVEEYKKLKQLRTFC